MPEKLEIATKIRDLVEKDNLREAFAFLKKHRSSHNRIDEVIIHSARFEDIEEDLRHDVIDPRTYSLEKNRIRKAILSIASNIEKGITTKPTSTSATQQVEAQKSSSVFLTFLKVLVPLILLGGIGWIGYNQAQLGSGEQPKVTDTPVKNPTTTTTPPPSSNEIVVSDVKSFLNAIKSDVTIRLKAGDYDLESASAAMASNEYAKVEPETINSSAGLTLKGINGLKLIGEEGTRVITSDYIADVLRLVDCKDIEIKNIFFGHPKLALCIGGVIDLINSERIQFDNCTLHGCGTTGIYTEGTNGLVVSNSTIQECTIGLVEAKNSSNFHFQDSKFIKSHGSIGFDFKTTSNVKLDGCTIQGNNYTEMLFKVEKPRVVLKNCTIESTSYSELVSGFPQFFEQNNLIIK